MANLLHIKGSRNRILNTLPSNTMGKDGDIILSSIQGKGIYLCSKVRGRWYVSNKMEELRKIEKTSIKDLDVNRLKIGNTTITKNEYDVSTGDLTLDVAGDIELNADGGNITLKDEGVTIAQFEKNASSDNRFTLQSLLGTANFFRVSTGANGVTSMATIDSDGTVGHLTLVPAGNLILDPASKITIINKSIVFNTQIHQDITSGGIAVNWNGGNKQSIDVTGTGYTLTMTNPAGPCNLILKVIQGDGSDTITTWAASSGSVYWSGGAIPTLSTGNGEIDIISFYFDGTNYFAVASLDFATV